MYCGQCGKKIMENMLFCPFCGSPVVIPEQDAAVPVQKPVQEPLPPQETFIPLGQESEAEAQVRPVSLFDNYEPEPQPESQPEPEPETFVPLSLIFAEDESPVPAPEIRPADDLHPDVAEELTRKPVQRPAAQTRRPENMQKRAANTYIPVKDIDPDDMFMDGYDDDMDDYDEYDDDYDSAYDAPKAPVRERYRDDDFDYEEPEHGGFFHRHIRGLVGLMLFLLLAVICAVWAFSANGQLALARMNLAWTAKPYAELGYEAYQTNSDLMAARYYEKALLRDETNYEYAHSAMVAYYEANEIESAAEMLKKCVEMDPDNSEPYLEMLILYPDDETRPWEINELVRQGYRRTGHEALNIDA